MGFNSPTLTTQLSAGGYAAELNANMENIQQAFNSIQTILSSTAASSMLSPLVGLTTSNHLAKLSQSGGVIGDEAFSISFNKDTDGNYDYAYISHPDALTAESNAVISERSLDGTIISPHWYTSSAAQNLNLADAVTGLGDGTFNICIGLKGNGAPSCLYKVVECSTTLDDTNYEESGIELPLYTMDYVVDSGTYTVKNVRRACDVLVSHDAFQKAYAAEHAITVVLDDPLPTHTIAGGGYADSMNTDGFVATVGGLVVPWDCEVIRAYVNVDSIGTAQPLDVNATDAEGTDFDYLPATDASPWEFTLYRGNYPEATPLGGGTPFGNTMEQVVEGPVYLPSNSETNLLRGFTQPAQLAAGTFIQPALGPFGDPERFLGTDAEPPTGMSITVVIRRHYEGIYA